MNLSFFDSQSTASTLSLQINGNHRRGVVENTAAVQ